MNSKLGVLTVLTMAAAMAFAAPALATLATSPKGTAYTGPLKGTSEGHVVFKAAIANVSCNGAVEGKIESHGPSVTGVGEATKWEYINCTNGWTVESVKTGTIEIHAVGEGKGTITSTGTVGRAKRLGVECVYETSATDLGLVTDSSLTGGKATLHLGGTIPRTGGSALCGPNVILEGSAVVNTPEAIFID